MGKGSTRRPAQVSEHSVKLSWWGCFGVDVRPCCDCHGMVRIAEIYHWITPSSDREWASEGLCYGCYLERLHEPTDRTESPESE